MSVVSFTIIISLLSTLLLILCILLIILITCRKKSVQVEDNLPFVKPYAQSYPLAHIDIATDGFNFRRIVGTGRLGTVYTATSSSSSSTNHLVAVKRIDPRLVLSNVGFGFSSKIKSLSLAHHPNIVPIIGFSEAPGERIIVMDFMPMKSLDFYLYHQESNSETFLDWTRRLKIMAGAARGIEYLHENMAPSIIHGCIKPSNILIDMNFCARVCDYGLTFLAPQDMRGIIGYVDKECLIEKKGVSKENDVYGFGVVLLEILSGRSVEDGGLLDWALPLIKEMKIVEILDPRIQVPLDINPLIRLAKLASTCVTNIRKNRPSIVQVVAILNNLEMQLF